MNQGRKFISVFKIDGIPILPPLITSDKRNMIQRYKEQAILVENNLNSRKQITDLPLSEQVALDSEYTFDDDYLKISSFLQSKVDFKNNTSPIQHLQKSDTLIYDVISNTVIIPYESRNTELSDLNQILQQNINSNEKININLQLTESADSINLQCKKYMPSVVVKPPTPENCSEICLSPNNFNGSPKRLSESPSPSDSDKPVNNNSSLIRSNSFILEKASSVLVDHMEKLEIKEQHENSSAQDVANKKKHISSFSLHKSPKIIGYKKMGIQNINDKTEIRKENIFTNTTLFKNRKSPYELEITRKTKAAKKHKSPILKTSSNVTLKTMSCNSSFHKNRSNENEDVCINKAFEDIEKQHKLQLIELTKKHQYEQNKMQEAFEYKQKLLLEHLAYPINSATLDNQNFQIDQIEKCTLNSEKNQGSNKNFKNNIISSKFYNNKSENKNVLKDSANNNLTTTPDRREIAASIINKYVRGYLTRRIFKTYFVQNIVMTIRDTLLFAINFHKQTKCNDNPENIKLKVRLLQQLKSSCYNLHDVFFELSSKQQMALISNDRMYKIKNKLIQEN